MMEAYPRLIAQPPDMPDQCPVCGAHIAGAGGNGMTVFLKYRCGGAYTATSPFYWDGACGEDMSWKDTPCECSACFNDAMDAARRTLKAAAPQGYGLGAAILFACNS